MRRIKYIYLFLLIFLGGMIFSGCAEDKQPKQDATSSIDYSFYRFLNHLDEAIEVSEFPRDINDRIATSVQAVYQIISLNPVEEETQSRVIDFSTSSNLNLFGGIGKLESWIPVSAKPVDYGVASIKLRFKVAERVAGLVLRYSENKFYFCGLKSGPQGSIFLARFLDGKVSIVDYSEFPVVLGLDYDLEILYHNQFFEIKLNKQLLRVAFDDVKPFSGKAGYFSTDISDANAMNLKTSLPFDDQARKIMDETAKWERLLFYRHTRMDSDLNLTRREHYVKANLGGERRSAFFLYPKGRNRFRIQIPASSRLDYGLGLPEELAGNRKITFRLIWETEKNAARELARFDLGNNESGRWIDKSVDLSALAGQKGTISFQALISEVGPIAPTAILVSNPLLRSTLPASKPNIIIYLVDSLRLDSLGVYGNQEGLSPHLDQWSSRSAVFGQAYSQAPWSKPSLTSIFLSLYPMVHTILQPQDKILPMYTTMPEWLSANGYVTACFSQNPITGAGSGLDQGFDHFFSHINLDQIHSFISRKDKQPFFLFIHTDKLHRPYDPPENIRKKFSSLTSGEVKSLNNDLRQFRSLGRQNLQRRATEPAYDNSDEQTGILDKIHSHAKDYRNLYKGEVFEMDRQFGEFLKITKPLTEDENTFMVFLSGNGEEFFEHDTVMSGDSLYQELIHVPLMISWPKRWKGGKRISQPVELIDLLPTLLEINGKAKPLGIQGNSLISLLDGVAGNKDVYSCRLNLDTFYKPYIQRRGSYGAAMIRWPYKVIYNQNPDTIEIFDLSKDPGEKNDLARQDTEFKEKLKNDLRQWIQVQNSLRATLSIKKDRMLIDISPERKLNSSDYLD